MCASATVIVAVAVALGAQAERFELADVQQDARKEAAEHAHEMKRAAEKREREKREREQREEASRSTPRPAVPSGSPKAIARSMVPAGQWACFDFIISHESGWNVHARNPSSGAYGLGQALPGSKMASAGPDWRNNPRTQLRWVLGYMNGRYGSPCGAMSFWKAHHWY